MTPALPYGIAEPAHPSGRQLSEFERRLLRVRLLGHEANLLFCSTTKTEERLADSKLLFSLQNYGHIIICRFLEAWQQFNSLAKTDTSVLKISRALSFYIDRLNEWPGLTDYRNWILAHEYQIGSSPEFIPPWVVAGTGTVPTKPAEVLVLLDCVRMASACLLSFYGDVYRELTPVLRVPSESPPPHGVTTGDEADTERLRLTRQAISAMTGLGVTQNDPVLREFICP